MDVRSKTKGSRFEKLGGQGLGLFARLENVPPNGAENTLKAGFVRNKDFVKGINELLCSSISEDSCQLCEILDIEKDMLPGGGEFSEFFLRVFQQRQRIDTIVDEDSSAPLLVFREADEIP